MGTPSLILPEPWFPFGDITGQWFPSNHPCDDGTGPVSEACNPVPGTQGGLSRLKPCAQVLNTDSTPWLPRAQLLWGNRRCRRHFYFNCLPGPQNEVPQPPPLQMRLQKDPWLASQSKYFEATPVLLPSRALGLDLNQDIEVSGWGEMEDFCCMFIYLHLLAFESCKYISCLKIKLKKNRCSCGGATGLVASCKRWDQSLTWHSGLRIWHCLQLQLGWQHQLESDPWPETPHAAVQPKKKKELKNNGDNLAIVAKLYTFAVWPSNFISKNLFQSYMWQYENMHAQNYSLKKCLL